MLPMVFQVGTRASHQRSQFGLEMIMSANAPLFELEDSGAGACGEVLEELLSRAIVNVHETFATILGTLCCIGSGENRPAPLVY